MKTDTKPTSKQDFKEKRRRIIIRRHIDHPHLAQVDDGDDASYLVPDKILKDFLKLLEQVKRIRR